MGESTLICNTIHDAFSSLLELQLNHTLEQGEAPNLTFLWNKPI